MSQNPALFAPRTLGPLPDDILATMIADAESTSLHDNCDVPGVYFQLLVLPALKELRDRRQRDRDMLPSGKVVQLGRDTLA